MGDGVKRERKGKERDGRWGKEREKGEKWYVGRTRNLRLWFCG